MRELIIADQSWTADDDYPGQDGSQSADLIEDPRQSADPVEAASLSYGYARI